MTTSGGSRHRTSRHSAASTKRWRSVTVGRLKATIFGERRSLQDGLWELKIDIGPGYRIYYALEAKTVLLVLAGGAKRTQQRDIAPAVEYWKEYRARS